MRGYGSAEGRVLSCCCASGRGGRKAVAEASSPCAMARPAPASRRTCVNIAFTSCRAGTSWVWPRNCVEPCSLASSGRAWRATEHRRRILGDLEESSAGTMARGAGLRNAGRRHPAAMLYAAEAAASQALLEREQRRTSRGRGLELDRDRSTTDLSPAGAKSTSAFATASHNRSSRASMKPAPSGEHSGRRRIHSGLSQCLWTIHPAAVAVAPPKIPGSLLPTAPDDSRPARSRPQRQLSGLPTAAAERGRFWRYPRRQDHARPMVTAGS